MRDWCSDVGSSDLVEALVDVVERQGVGDEVVDVDLALHVPVDDLGHVGAPARAAEGGALPDPSGDELEGTGGDLLAGAGDADDDRRSEEHTSELQSLMRNSDSAFCLKKKTHK